MSKKHISFLRLVIEGNVWTQARSSDRRLKKIL